MKIAARAVHFCGCKHQRPQWRLVIRVQDGRVFYLEKKMPKMKTHRGAAKRFKATGSGKVRRNKAFKSHILTKKTRKRKRNMRKGGLVAPADAAAIRKMLPGLA